MLKNPSFNGGTWRKTHTGHEFGEIEVPEEWTAWWVEGQTPIPWDPANTQGYRRPEMKVISFVAPFIDPPRVSQPPKAVQLFTFQGIHEAGLYQRVTGLEPGKALRATFAVHGWSSVYDDPRKSEFCEGGPYNMMFTIGIDPNGGTDPWSFSVVWGEPTGVYNKFRDVLVEGVKVGLTGTVSVFVRSQVRWRFKHNDAYMDDVRLEYMESTTPPPEPPVPPAPSPTTFPVTKQGSKLGIHSILPAQTLKYVQDVKDAGGHVATVKAVADLGWLKEVKAIDPKVITVGRFIGLPGDVDTEGPPLTGNLAETAQKIWNIVWPKFAPHIAYTDYLEITNELDPVGPEGHTLFAKLWMEIIKVVNNHNLATGTSIKLAILSYSLGVPEWIEWEAIVATGLFQLAKDSKCILALHEYASPVEKWWGQAIPGRTADPNHGPLMCRYRWLYEDLLIPAGLEIPLIITEANMESVANVIEKLWVTQMAWYDVKMREDWYVIGANLFTLDGTDAWPQFNYGKFMPALTQHVISQVGMLNAQYPYTASEEMRYDRTVYMADPTYMTPAQITQAYETGKQLLRTVTPSWNDAVPFARYRPTEWLTNTVNAGPVPIADQNRYKLWVSSRDPDTVLNFSLMNHFRQGDLAWKAVKLGTSSYTMGTSGCLVTAVAEWMRMMVEPTTNPLKLVNWLNANGGFTSGGNLYFAKPTEIPGLPKKFKFTTVFKSADSTTFNHVKELLSSTNAPVIIQVDFQSDADLDSHFVLVTKSLQNDLLIVDPWTGTQELLMERYPRGTIDQSIFAIVVYELVETTPPPPELPLLGFNDPNDEGAYNFLTGVAGPSLVVIPVFIGANTTPEPMHFANSDIRVIVNIRYSWSVDMGGGGTLPYATVLLDKFIRGAQYLIEHSTGVWGWTIGNEANNPRESPDGVHLRAFDVVEAYNSIRRGVLAGTRMSPGALDPFNAQLGNVADWLDAIYTNIDGAEFVAMHGYIRGPDASLVLSKDKFQDAPLQWQSLNYVGCVLDLAEYLPAQYKDLPIYVTEFNHIWVTSEADGRCGWVTDARAGEVIAAAYGVALANKFGGLAIYRWMSDDWAVFNNDSVLNTVKSLVEETYG